MALIDQLERRIKKLEARVTALEVPSPQFDGGDAATATWTAIYDGGDAATTSFEAIYDGGTA
jgi:hypothetical protein